MRKHVLESVTQTTQGNNIIVIVILIIRILYYISFRR